ncbi:hypothetical protein [Fischerella thermalis]|uniref:hypothetical protein n=1 Tax=Fischerella thermalis TaxID=372787 RepID=UPI0015E0B76C|nr:hypothetical protein [Fischerella thermalis]
MRIAAKYGAHEEKQDQIVMKSYTRDGKEAFLQELRELSGDSIERVALVSGNSA